MRQTANQMTVLRQTANHKAQEFAKLICLGQEFIELAVLFGRDKIDPVEFMTLTSVDANDALWVFVVSRIILYFVNIATIQASRIKNKLFSSLLREISGLLFVRVK